MKRLLRPAFALLMISIATSAAMAAEKTITLAVSNMYCAACPYTVKKSLSAVDGVKSVKVSFEKKTAIVTYDDSKASIEQLTDATFEAGYPSEVRAR